MTTTTAALLPHHQQLLDLSRISKEIADLRGYFSATDPAELRAIGFSPSQCRVPALVIPGTDPAGNNGRYQIRPDKPRPGTNGKGAKYESAAGAGVWIDTHPAILSLLDDLAVPLWITEGARKADAAISAGLCCVSVQGVWSWRVLDQWARIPLKGRTVYICFDSDVTTKPEVREALAALTAFLASLGAKVRIVKLPPGEDGAKAGLDDVLAAGATVAELEGYAGPVIGLRDLVGLFGDDEDEGSEATRQRERAGALQSHNEALRRENTQLREKDALLRRALRNPEVREEVPTALALMEVTTTVDGEPKQAIGWQKLYRPKVATIANVSEATVSRHFKRLAALNVHRRDLRPGANGRNRLWAGCDPEMDVLRRLAYAEPVDDAPTVASGRRRDWGKFRWQCRDHPHAGITIRIIRQCSECGALCERVPVQDDAEDAPAPRDQVDREGPEVVRADGEDETVEAGTRDQVDRVIYRTRDQVDREGDDPGSDRPPPTPLTVCSDCGKRPPVLYHQRCQSCILDQLPRAGGQQRAGPSSPAFSWDAAAAAGGDA